MHVVFAVVAHRAGHREEGLILLSRRPGDMGWRVEYDVRGAEEEREKKRRKIEGAEFLELAGLFGFELEWRRGEDMQSERRRS